MYDPESFYADDGSDASDASDERAMLATPKLGPAHHLHRATRAPPQPTECHALGSLTNASFSVIKARLCICDGRKCGADCAASGRRGARSWASR